MSAFTLYTIGLLGYWVIAFLRSTQRMKNQMFVYLASCFLTLAST
ncbi:MAG: hypothetical protein AB1765_01310 [Candidatus Hydrogenedentota bacterium]